jgi:hypothetical protein
MKSLKKFNSIPFPVNELKKGSAALTRIKESPKANNVNKRDSLKNCVIIWLLVAPTTFLKPTSLERLEERAVARLMKLTQAMISMKKAMTEKIVTYLISPLGLISACRWE